MTTSPRHPKANVVLDVDTATLDGLVGRVVRIGECTLTVTQKPSQCAGVYAEVLEPGTVPGRRPAPASATRA